MRRWKLTVAYDGTHFHGWQRQEVPGGEPLRTVQGVLESTINSTFSIDARVVGASRTDAGVHARAQVAAFDCNIEIDGERLARAISARLPDDVAVIAAEPVHAGFDPIGDCVSKGYRYTFRDACPNAHRAGVFERLWVAATPHAVDIARMQAAAGMLVGTHDFAGLAHSIEDRATTVRTIHGCSVRRMPGGEVAIDVSGTGFLHNMVRILAGTLLDVGRGHREPGHVRTILASRDRSLAGPTMPAQGLCLEWILYPKAGDQP